MNESLIMEVQGVGSRINWYKSTKVADGVYYILIDTNHKNCTFDFNNDKEDCITMTITKGCVVVGVVSFNMSGRFAQLPYMPMAKITKRQYQFMFIAREKLEQIQQDIAS